MRNDKHTAMPAIVVVLLSLAFVCSCSAAHKMKKTPIEGGTAQQPDADSLHAQPQDDSLRDRPQADNSFTPLHPPVVVPYTWREAMSK
jgi:hypothetical protein